VSTNAIKQFPDVNQQFPGKADLTKKFTGSDDENAAVGLRGAGDHVLDEVPVPGRVNDGDVVLGRLELPERNVDGNAALTLRLQLVQHPGVLEGALTHLQQTYEESVLSIQSPYFLMFMGPRN
jgi:hypothetical protein